MQRELVSTSPAHTRALGRRIGRLAAPGTLLALSGPLGAGKTQFAKGVAEGLDVTNVVNSPTFIIVNEHPGRLVLFHVDAYRISGEDEARQAGVFDERMGSGVTVIEWADRLRSGLPADRLDILIEPNARSASQRMVRLAARGPRHEELAAAIALRP